MPHTFYRPMDSGFADICLQNGAGLYRPGYEYFPPPTTFSNTADIELSDFQSQNHWWETFNDPEIDRVVINVIENNPDIQTAAARVLEARSIFKQTRADQYPVLNMSTDAGRQSYAAFNPLTGRRAASTSNSYSLSLPASFEIDFWGRLSRATEAARARLLSAEENRRTVVQSLIAEAVSLYLKIESPERRIQVTNKSIHIFRQRLEVIESRYKRGVTTVLDVAIDRYNRGLVDYLTVLDAKQAKVDAELQLITAEYEILSNHVRLCRALGGEWDLKLTNEIQGASGKNT